MVSLLRRLSASSWPAAVMVTVITLVTAGTIAVVATPAGCGLAAKVGVRLAGSRCQHATQAVALASPTASTPIPSTGPAPSAPALQASPSPSQEPSPSPTANPTPVNTVPHNPSLPPYEFDISSGSYPPSYPASSGSGPPDTSVSLSCRLPIYAGGPGSGGFLVFPDRSFIGDPRSGVTVPSPAPGSPSPPPQGPGGPGYFYGLSYDPAVARWLPVPRTWMAPDGKHYAYPDFSDGIEVVDTVSNTQTKVGAGKHWQVIALQAEGVYAEEPSLAGLWLLTFSGAASQVTPDGYWTAVGGGAAYGTDTSSVPNGVPTVIVRFDLKTHSKQNWFEVTNASSTVFGFDVSGRPIINVQGFGNYQSELWLVTGLGLAEVLAYNNNFSGPPVGDSHGIWIMNYQAAFLFVEGQGLLLEATIGGQLAGGCY